MLPSPFDATRPAVRSTTIKLERYGCALAPAGVLAAWGSAALAAPSYPVHNPRVVIHGAGLQGYLNGVGESINVETDQLQAQTSLDPILGNSGMTIMIQLGSLADQTTLGIYDATLAAPVLYPVPPPVATPRKSALLAFHVSGTLVVNCFDDTGVMLGTLVYPGAVAVSGPSRQRTKQSPGGGAFAP